MCCQIKIKWRRKIQYKELQLLQRGKILHKSLKALAFFVFFLGTYKLKISFSDICSVVFPPKNSNIYRKYVISWLSIWVRCIPKYAKENSIIVLKIKYWNVIDVIQYNLHRTNNKDCWGIIPFEVLFLCCWMNEQQFHFDKIVLWKILVFLINLSNYMWGSISCYKNLLLKHCLSHMN